MARILKVLLYIVLPALLALTACDTGSNVEVSSTVTEIANEVTAPTDEPGDDTVSIVVIMEPTQIAQPTVEIVEVGVVATGVMATPDVNYDMPQYVPEVDALVCDAPFKLYEVNVDTSLYQWDGDSLPITDIDIDSRSGFCAFGFMFNPASPEFTLIPGYGIDDVTGETAWGWVMVSGGNHSGVIFDFNHTQVFELFPATELIERQLE